MFYSSISHCVVWDRSAVRHKKRREEGGIEKHKQNYGNSQETEGEENLR